jgi:hypothetical protein
MQVAGTEVWYYHFQHMCAYIYRFLVLERAFVRNSDSEQIWLAAVKLEAENGELDVARKLLVRVCVRARIVADTGERVITISFIFSPNTGTRFVVYLFPRFR